ncbi:DUF1254 domain-containing protein [Bradyrhizobium monzae]|uniref:DUF1254 domain-containing protein n=1 Tax=Bradyrhizobium sp. Oc8 TaxID=2876780 RepID=UPI001F1FEFDA|nr:DUF1254 domain-containing protein [Bradyrhizobium sp. Oc8]
MIKKSVAAVATFVAAQATLPLADGAPASLSSAAYAQTMTAQDGQVPPPQSGKDVPSPVAGAPISPEYANVMGRFAYIWGWPLVNMHNRHAVFGTAPHPGLLGGVLPVAPVGQLAMLSDYVAPEQRFVTSPNQDVVYGAGFFSLDEQPVVIQVPDFADRFWVYQIVDQRSDSFAEVGIQYGTRPGMYLLVGPNWHGQAPAGINAVYRSSTNIAAIFPRVFMDDTKQDRDAIQPLLNHVMAYPLSKYTGKMQTADWKGLPTIENPNAGSSGETQWVIPDKFFEQLPVVMNEVPPLPGEEALYAQIYFVLNAAKNNPSLQSALKEAAVTTEKNVIKDMFEFRNNGVDVGNGWRTQKNAARFGFGYFQRTATAKGNMFSNVPNETMYFGADFDSNGERLGGKNAYKVTFKPGQTPPVKGFWSLTLYNQQHFFAQNKLDRYSLGTKNKGLKKDADGSLTIYVQPNNPGGDKEANWLPAPDGDFSLYIRAYWPEEGVINGSWPLPTIQRN